MAQSNRLDFSAFKLALTSLDEALEYATPLEYNSVAFRVARAGVIQNFEFTYELSWKFLKRQLEKDLGKGMIDGLARRELFRIAHKHKLIEDVELWFAFHEARNETSHTYHSETADEVFEICSSFLHASKLLFNQLVNVNLPEVT